MKTILKKFIFSDIIFIFKIATFSRLLTKLTKRSNLLGFYLP